MSGQRQAAVACGRATGPATAGQHGARAPGIRVATYNIHSCVGADGRRDSDRIAAVLSEIDADIVALQEVDSRLAQRGHHDQFDYFARLEGYAAIPGPNIRLERGQYGNALLTRWPVLRTRPVDLTVPPYEPRGVIDVELDVDGMRLRVLATHLGLRLRERRRQRRRLRQLVAAQPALPALVLGDFNVAWPESLTLPGRGRRGREPASYPAAFPVLALDRIRAHFGAVVDAAWSHRSALARAASDHLPVVAQVRLAGTAEALAPSPAPGAGRR